MALRKPLHMEWPIFRWVRLILGLGSALAFVQISMYVIGTNSHVELAKAVVPILATYIATASLFYNRARAIGEGKSRSRSLYAAERSMQGIVFTITGLLLGAIVYFLMSFFRVPIVISENQIDGAWFMVYVPALSLVFLGYLTYLQALGSISKEFLRPIPAREICKRVSDKAPN